MTGSHSGPVDSTDPHLTDPGLLKDNSEFRSYKTSRFEYRGIRIFYRQHAKANELPKTPAPLPLLVFIHGLGGSVAQFHPLLSSIIDLGPCLAIDLPGCGRSEFSVPSWDAYTTDALVELLETIIDDYRDKDAGQGAILIGHSMGTALAARLANRKSPHTTSLSEYVLGLVAICPVAGPPNESLTAWARRALWIPGWLFDLWRAWDGWGGPESPSVKRFVGPEADLATRQLQYRYNKQSRTPVWRRMANGALPIYKNGKAIGGLPGLEVWKGLNVPTYLIAGEKDNVVSPKEVDKIIDALTPGKQLSDSETEETSKVIVDAAAPVNATPNPVEHIPQRITDITDEDFQKIKPVKQPSDDGHDDPSTPSEPTDELPPLPRHPEMALHSFIMPPPATHALLYTPSTVRALAGLISDFLSNHVTGRLSLAWQLQYLSREGKWDVKNLQKWKSVNPVSEPIGPADAPVFRAMKTLREVDDVHCPAEFTTKWSNVIKDVIDISKDQPVYDPRGLERAGVHYHKFPTVSKIPPQATEVEAFIKLVDSLREQQAERAKTEEWDDPEKCVVGVHCHYGFNRTGYFIVCYLVERCGYGVKEAIEAFAKARPNGIRHSHFLDRLYVRYKLETTRSHL